MKKSYSLFFSLLVFFVSAASAQSYIWQWAETCVQPNNSGASTGINGVASDPSGNVVAAGYFHSDSIRFGSYTLHNADPTESTADIFLVKYDPSGTVQWAASASGAKLDEALSVTADMNGNIYVTGYFYSDSVQFGSYTIHNYGPTDTTDDIFLVKYSPAGMVLWAKSFGGDYYDGGEGVATDASGNVFVGGFYRSDSIAFGSYTLYDATGTNSPNAFLVKCDGMGNVQWAAGTISTGLTDGYAVCTDASGDAFMTGRFNGASVGFGSQSLQNQLAGSDDIFLVKYDPSGNVLWAESAGGTANDDAYGVACDAQGNAFITGYFNSDSAYFGAQMLMNDTTDGSGDIFLAKYNSSGSLLWAKGFGGDHSDVARGLVCDGAGDTYLSGYYYSQRLIFGSDTLINHEGNGTYDGIFVAACDPNGNVLLGAGASGDNDQAGYGIAYTPANIYVGGDFHSDTLLFGSNRLVNNSTTHDANPFVADYRVPGVGIIAVPELPSIILFPNPANDMLYAQSESFTSSEVTVAVYDVTGATVPVKYTISNGRFSLDVGELAGGMYWIKFNVGGSGIITKFVKADR